MEFGLVGGNHELPRCLEPIALDSSITVSVTLCGRGEGWLWPDGESDGKERESPTLTGRPWALGLGPWICVVATATGLFCHDHVNVDGPGLRSGPDRQRRHRAYGCAAPCCLLYRLHGPRGRGLVGADVLVQDDNAGITGNPGQRGNARRGSCDTAHLLGYSMWQAALWRQRDGRRRRTYQQGNKQTHLQPAANTRGALTHQPRSRYWASTAGPAFEGSTQGPNYGLGGLVKPKTIH